jgi:hypothetical protein
MEIKEFEIQFLEEEKKRNNLRNSDIDKLLDNLKDEPFKYLFRLNTEFGEAVENICQEILFENVLRITNNSHDLKIVSLPEGVTDERLESKAFRILKGKTDDCSYYGDRAISIYDNKIGYSLKTKTYRYLESTTTFQQIKPKSAHLFICIAVYSDGLDIFLLKSDEHFTSVENCVGVKEEGKCYITGQHKGNLTEGQVSINDDVVLDNYKFSIIGKNGKFYYFDRDKKQILEEYQKIDITTFL